MPADFTAERYEVAIVEAVSDEFPDWVNEFKRSPARIVKFARKKYPNLRQFKKINDFEIHSLLSNAAEKLVPGKVTGLIFFKSYI